MCSYQFRALSKSFLTKDTASFRKPPLGSGCCLVVPLIIQDASYRKLLFCSFDPCYSLTRVLPFRVLLQPLAISQANIYAIYILLPSNMPFTFRSCPPNTVPLNRKRMTLSLCRPRPPARLRPGRPRDRAAAAGHHSLRRGHMLRPSPPPQPRAGPRRLQPVHLPRAGAAGAADRGVLPARRAR